MPITRDNHYVPEWYQKGFFEPGRNSYAYLDLSPKRGVLPDGRAIVARSRFEWPASKCFYQTDLYSTFFGTSVNDEIERSLFGDVDSRGATAVRAFIGTDATKWHENFEALFDYLDIQKTRTPKGLDWLSAQYPSLSQNELMFEMQGVRQLHHAIWMEGVREIVSAENAEVKFIATDNPVSVYNYAMPPEASGCAYPNDPGIELKASQTLFPLNRDFCLILTNLEYAKDPQVNPLEKRTFARRYKQSMVNTIAFIRSRMLSSAEVSRINLILKARARRYVAAGRKEWLDPELTVTGPWRDLRAVLQPPSDELFHFGGEMYAKFESGHVHYQDEFGRTEKQRSFLKKTPPTKPLRPGDPCGCGSGLAFRECCEGKPPALRPSWSERSIRERNLMFATAIVNVLGLAPDRDWVTVRRELTDEQISKVYWLFEGLWPLETDLLSLLPKPDGTGRAVYTGSIHPRLLAEFAMGASLYFGPVLIAHPFVHAGIISKDYSPVEHPHTYRQEFLKAVLTFLKALPLVERGLVNLVPDPGTFDAHLRKLTMHMARSRVAGLKIDPDADPRLKEIMKDALKRGLMLAPEDYWKRQLREMHPELDASGVEELTKGLHLLREADPLAVLQPDSLVGDKGGGQLSMFQLAPNFEMSMYLAQATGASIITDSVFRWNEVQRAMRLPLKVLRRLDGLGGAIETSTFAFPDDVEAIARLAANRAFQGYPSLMGEALRHLSRPAQAPQKPNFEASLAARFKRTHQAAQRVIRKSQVPCITGRISGALPPGGIQDNTINRLLLMSSSEHHLPAVPMAFFIERGASQTSK